MRTLDLLKRDAGDRTLLLGSHSSNTRAALFAFDAAERAVGPEAEEPALPGFVDRADTVDNPEGSDRDRTCRWGEHDRPCSDP